MPGSYLVGVRGVVFHSPPRGSAAPLRVVDNDEVPVRVIQNTGGHRRDADTPEHEPWPGEMPIDSECGSSRPGGVEVTALWNGGSRMAGVTRRTFLGRGSMAVAAAGVLS